MHVRGVVQVANGPVTVPLEGAIVSIEGKTITDSQGVYDIAEITPGTYPAEVLMPMGAVEEPRGTTKGLENTLRIWSGVRRVNVEGFWGVPMSLLLDLGYVRNPIHRFLVRLLFW